VATLFADAFKIDDIFRLELRQTRGLENIPFICSRTKPATRG